MQPPTMQHTRALLLLVLLPLLLSYVDACAVDAPPESERRDCYPESGASQGGCEAKGCIWCEAQIQGTPWCFFPDGKEEVIKPCAQYADWERRDCHPEPGSSEEKCLSKGCCWSPASTQGAPWCFYGDAGAAPPPSGGGDDNMCQTVIPELDRIDCSPNTPVTQGSCEASGCVWCPAQMSGYDIPWCFFNQTEFPGAEEAAARVDCMPEGGSDPAKCQQRGCIYAPANVPGAPFCHLPSDGSYGYSLVGQPANTARGLRFELQRIHTTTMFGGDLERVTLDVEFHTQDRLRFKFYDPNSNRFEVPLEIPRPDSAPAVKAYDFQWSNDNGFSIKVVRKDTGAVLFDTSLAGLTFADQFLQIATRLPSSRIYGLGEHERSRYRQSLNFKTYGMYSRDQPPTANGNLYGVHNFYMCLEDDAKAHGVLLLNANAQEVALSPLPGITYRTIGGVLDFYVFLGPTPEGVVQQYTEAVGRPFLPPYWSLGFQLSRYGYNSLETVRATVDRMRASDIPHDVQFGDIDYMQEQRDFTIDNVRYAGLGQYVKDLQKDGMRYVIILDPCLTKDDPPGSYRPYDLGNQLGVWVNNSDGVTPAVGKVWPPGGSVFPDYGNPVTRDWWIQMCVEFMDVLNYDGLWIDMNEPANFGTGQQSGCAANKWNNPPFKPRTVWGDTLADKTLCPDSVSYLGLHYDTHSLFGWSQSEPSYAAAERATGKRAFVVSRSTFPGSGRYVAHWTGDNHSQWSNVHISIVGMFDFNLFGIPYVGADICGFNGDVQEELCLRWMQLGAFYPFSRNHNGLNYKEQDPAAFGANFASIARDALRVRYTLLPYLYTLFHDAHTLGSTVVRPLLHEFPEDSATHDIDRVFLWGPALMIAPVLTEQTFSIDVYLPDARWFDYYKGTEVSVGKRKTSITVDAPLETIPIFVRGGYVLPTQDPERTTSKSRHNPMGLLVALDDTGSAKGSLYWDDGDSIDPIEKGNYFLASYSVSGGELHNTVQVNGSPDAKALSLGAIRVLGVSSKPTSVTVNGQSWTSYTHSSTGELVITGVSQSISSPLSIRWA
ncbi:lysosomal alpha-glucosidase-like [Lethenteron reissneri]|uniref:lysosomal alpha-glucosidase-like n=1 Tax=Lethenteron reissneri TaxID=7753 RepID=UPI002AB6EB9D|nr:lysosomal alpha-glucosidase-like [Lethenteron reissneri]